MQFIHAMFFISVLDFLLIFNVKFVHQLRLTQSNQNAEKIKTGNYMTERTPANLYDLVKVN